MDFLRRLCLTLLVLAWPACVPARSLEEIRHDGKLVVATEGQFVPFNYMQGAKVIGFEIDLAEAVARKAGLTIEWRVAPFDSLLPGLRQDRWDLVVASHGITDSRAKIVSFADPHYCTGGVIVTKDPSIRSLANLADRVIAVQAGSSYEEKVRQGAPNAKEIRAFARDLDARAALLNGRADVWVTDQFVAMDSVFSHRSWGLQMGLFVFIERVAAAASKGNAELVGLWNHGLAQIEADGTYAAISKRYFGQDIRCQP